MKQLIFILAVLTSVASCKSKDDGPLTTDEKNMIDTTIQRAIAQLDTSLSKQCVNRHDSLLNHFQDSLYTLRKKQIQDEMNNSNISQ